jgi:iron(III) transport system ATP-binding protein
MGKTALKVDGLRKSFTTDHGGVRAVQGISFAIEEGDFFTLLGPSGCGKTTTLRCVAGLERPEEGEITIGDSVVVSSKRHIFVPPHERDIGMVFQSYAIWPHMNVFDNVAFPLTQGNARLPKSEVREKVMWALELVKLNGLERRPAPQLSGGQQQRLALARALVRRPVLLLLDEPLSNLDAKLREEMRGEVRRLTRELGITTLYVTHDQIEALTMSDVVAIMRDGEIVQVSSPKEIYTSPQSEFAAGFVGTTNVFHGTLTRAPDPSGIAEVRTAVGTLRCLCPVELSADQTVAVSVRPENITLSPTRVDEPGQNGNVLAGTINAVIFLGEYLDCRVAVGEEMVRVRVHPSAPVREGQRAYLTLPAEQCRGIAADSRDAPVAEDLAK